MDDDGVTTLSDKIHKKSTRLFVCLYQFQDLFEFMRIYDGGINILGWSSRGSYNSITADNAVSLQKQHTRDNHIVANDHSRVHHLYNHCDHCGDQSSDHHNCQHRKELL